MRQTFREGGGFEEAAASSRAVRLGQHVAVSGTAARHGAGREDVLRSRLLLADGCDWEGVVRAHRDAFAGVEPANTTYFVSGFIPEGVLVEVELDAIIPEPPR